MRCILMLPSPLREAVMTAHLNSDAMVERRLRDARQAHSEHLRITGGEGSRAQRSWTGVRGLAAVVVAVLALLALASFQSPTPSAGGISPMDLTRTAGTLPIGSSYDAH